ncbi:T9SS type A sorting domain-containing protein [Chryseobacterium jejuense]|uniref:Por secretion system C-terminal sorting domain n=1 Tax=Chryseobacterium jejuense TaxID=445960 RepID=A0A2X2WV26_CHRJE|nr:T9SS type A sorting domain-containing protein [Chryseobacterium jejuense]SDI28326.1 Por secretion system C-terminal sorting domain-containing protein [Chryseobacterium jejuense]SQB44588.1 Por secretion system C-terminal sorting domain [Chryseobacterium jejuense]
MKTTFFTLSLFLVSFSIQISAQETLNTSGNNMSGSTGSATASIGQSFYETMSSSAGSVTAGVQQTYEIIPTLGIDIIDINLSLNIFPNPTTDILNLKVGFKDYNKYRYDLFDSSGKLLTSQSITQSTTQITMTSYPASIYLLKISKGGKDIKIFKVLKNK